MEKVMDFNNFINESKERQEVAGVAIVWGAKILLVHPTNASWQKNVMGIPKGGVEKGEAIIDAALRELREETGIILGVSDLEPEPLTSPKYDDKGNMTSQMTYYIKRIKDPSEIGLSDGVVPKTQLQAIEVDWAGFIDIEKAYAKMNRFQLIILDRLR